jgi:hypothetical protein
MQIWHGTADTILFYPNFGEQEAVTGPSWRCASSG